MAKKRTPPSLIPSTIQEVVIPQDLQDQMGAVEACATAFNVLDKGYFPHSYSGAVKMSLQFLKKLHEQSVEQARQHPAAHMIPELSNEVQNGETKAANQDA